MPLLFLSPLPSPVPPPFSSKPDYLCQASYQSQQELTERGGGGGGERRGGRRDADLFSGNERSDLDGAILSLRRRPPPRRSVTSQGLFLLFPPSSSPIRYFEGRRSRLWSEKAKSIFALRSGVRRSVTPVVIGSERRGGRRTSEQSGI